jgi:hypothetical protein
MEGAMQFRKTGLAAAAMVGALSTTVQAGDCTRITAVGEMVTRDTAVLFSTNALKNLLAAKGLVGNGPVQTTCKDEATSTTCRSTQTACKGGTPKTCLGAWLCF